MVKLNEKREVCFYLLQCSISLVIDIEKAMGHMYLHHDGLHFLVLYEDKDYYNLVARGRNLETNLLTFFTPLIFMRMPSKF